MNTKDFLKQAYRLDQRINSKLDQIASLNALATKCTVTMSDMPHAPNHGKSTMADAVCKIIDLQSEINKDVDGLVALKRSITQTIKNVQNPEYQTLLELRYLCFKSWEQIAVDMAYSIQHVFRLHELAINSISK